MTDPPAHLPQPPSAKKIRSCSSSESTNPPTAAAAILHPEDVSALLDAARRYETEATLRHTQAQAEVSSAKDEVLASMEIVRRAHERLGRAEALEAETRKSSLAAKEYLARMESRYLKSGVGVVVGGGKTIKAAAAHLATSAHFPGVSTGAAAGGEENDEDQKHVSFAPQHPLIEPTPSSGSVESSQRKARRKRIRVSEHGWGIYEGQLDTLGEPHGRGTVTWENGGKYEGEWVDGKANGHGVMHYGNGDRYEGHWKDGSRFGMGTHQFKDGGVYEGEWRNAAPDGHGKMTLKNGSHYEGCWKDGKWHGPGIVRPVNGGEWEGHFEFGKCTVGTLRRPNGELEIGRYDSVNPDDVKEGVWWSIDRHSIWCIEDGLKKEQISPERALEIATKIGVALPHEVNVPLQAATAPPAPSAAT
mmetsp:Transcript_150/g.380  ORF Transcript_150/g.380 Transcript_150/m.380 type:complete len:417 (-) Transcript_150:451-1701(-)|eukprot:CAMPEP_0171345546 /NCGR_PEP_ID=MMETSP0878-20121228/21902_1 /TAXON_ID=67004 /ORGANISM="Thalassiosira weissflogii, Strain CCMP1336" /LENGTH=416 /DNA_ID=CAMNT_0011848985 /DNA_START=61 /DNA_END=1314 /DNA_ORIENTATION=+